MTKTVLLSCFLIGAALAPVAAQERGSSMENMGKTAVAAASSAFSEEESLRIKEFFERRATVLGQGKASEGNTAADRNGDDDDNDIESSAGQKGEAQARGNAKSKGKSKGKSAKGRGKGRGAQNAGRGRPSLPPGIAKNLERGKELPPGIARNYLPSALEADLPTYEGKSRVVIDDDVVLVDDTTGVIVDIIQDVLNQ